MSVIPKKLPEITKEDKTFPIVLWMYSPDILCFVKYDHKKNGKVTLKQAKKIPGRICYELNDFRFGNVLHCENRAYFGTVTYTKNDKLKIITTNKGKLFYFDK